MRESFIQNRVCQFAEEQGWLVKRFRERSDPDRIFFKKGLTIIIEFKAPKKYPTAAQILNHKDFNDRGFVVFVVDNIAEGKNIFR